MAKLNPIASRLPTKTAVSVPEMDAADFGPLLERMSHGELDREVPSRAATTDAAWLRGYLLKKSDKAGWQRRFFVLEPPMLYIYDSEGGEPVGLICECRRSKVPEHATAAGIEGAFTFFVAEDTTLDLCAAAGSAAIRILHRPREIRHPKQGSLFAMRSSSRYSRVFRFTAESAQSNYRSPHGQVSSRPAAGATISPRPPSTKRLNGAPRSTGPRSAGGPSPTRNSRNCRTN